jgi:hypothetical protein
MQEVVIHIREFNDCDHLAPTIWKLLDSEWLVTIVPYRGFNAEDDYRIIQIKKHFANLKFFYPSRIYFKKSHMLYKIFTKLNFKNLFTKSLFQILNLPFRIFEGCLFKNNPIVIWDWGNPGRVNHFEALLYNLKTVVLPHGINIWLNPYNTKIDFSDRSIYDYYFVNSEFHKNYNSSFLNMNEQKLFAMGSPRFSKLWIKQLLGFLKNFDFGHKNNKKVLYLLPHADHAPNFQEIENLIIRLAEIDNIALVLKVSTRQRNAFTPEVAKRFSDANNIYFDSNTPSTSLIEWSDTVINHGSSVVFDALQLNKRVIHARFLDNLETIFDDSDCVHHADDINEICKIIEHSNCYKAKNSSEFIKQWVYMNKNTEPVVEIYNFLSSIK